MNAYFERLFRYNHWANSLFIDALEATPPQDEKGLGWMSHVMAAQFIWYERVVASKQYNLTVWGSTPLPELRRLNEEGLTLWLELIAKEGPAYDKMVEYINTKGVAFATPLAEIMAHVANHGTHHRGQIASLLAREGHKPPASDFIFYVRTPKA